MTPNTKKMISFGYVIPVAVALFCSDACAAKRDYAPRSCDRVAVDSVKLDVGIRHDKIVRFSRTRGLTGPIIYVEIEPPIQTDSTNRIRRMILWWAAHPKTGAICKLGPDIGQMPAQNCSESVPGTELQLDITFEHKGVHNLEMRTNELVKYVLDEVLCQLE